MGGTVLRLNKPKVISEAFEDEVVAINLETGAYFGMAGAAKQIWALIENEVPEAAVSERVAQMYGLDRQKVEPEVRAFVDSLIEQSLICRAPGNGVKPPAAAERVTAPWQTPALAVFDDMKDLLLLDPIHDVDESGWPMKKQETVE